MSELCMAKRVAFMKLLTTEGAFAIRRKVDKNIRDAVSIEVLCGAIEQSDISSIEKIRLMETFN